jgi:hypothetical protein
MTTVIRSIRFATKGRRKRAVVAPVANASVAGQDARSAEGGEPDANVGRVPRVARLMALAIRFDQLLHDGVVSSQSELARLAHVTQPRMTQIMNLLHLAPDIQEAILQLPPTTGGRDAVTERDVRPILALVSWSHQRKRWSALQQTHE